MTRTQERRIAITTAACVLMIFLVAAALMFAARVEVWPV